MAPPTLEKYVYLVSTLEELAKYHPIITSHPIDYFTRHSIRFAGIGVWTLDSDLRTVFLKIERRRMYNAKDYFASVNTNVEVLPTYKKKVAANEKVRF